MQHQLAHVAGALRGQALQNVLEVLVGVMPIELGRLDQARDGSCALTSRERAGEQPILSAHGPRPDRKRPTIELHRGAMAAKVTWPVPAAPACTAWLRDLLR